MRDAVGDLTVVNLMDRSRQVVDASRGGATLLLEEIFGKNNVQTIQTRPGVEHIAWILRSKLQCRFQIRIAK